MTFFESTLLGLVQGLTEFLPVSSSGHLVIFQRILNTGNQVQFDVFLHFATLFAVLFFFRKDIYGIIKDIFNRGSAGQRTLLGMIAGSIPTAILGLLFKDFFEEKFSQPKIVSSMLIVTGIILWFASMYSKSDFPKKEIFSTKISDFLIIGILQGCAIMPGISRAGVTIAAALFLQMDQKWAFKYSMLLSIPAILGAGILELNNFSITPVMLAGGITAAVFGIAALVILSKIVAGKKLHIFTYYLIPVGILGLIFL